MVLSEGDRAALVRTLGDACLRAGWRVHAFVLMRNPYHLLLETLAAQSTGGNAVVSDQLDGAV